MHTRFEMGLAAADRVESLSRDGRARDIWLPWTFRRILGLRGSPLAIGAGAVLLSLAVDAVWFNASGLWHGYRVEGRPFWLHPYASYNFAYAVYLGFAVVALFHLVRGADRDLSQLGPALGLAPERLAEVRRDVLSVPARSLRVGTAVGLMVAAFDLWLFYAYLNVQGRFDAMTLVWVAAREILYDVLVYRVLTWAILVALRLSRLARKGIRVRLLDLGPLRPFTQNGVRLALFWLVLWAIWVPVMFVNPLDEHFFLASSALIGFQIALTTVAISLPTLGASRCVSDAKAAELAELRNAIERDRGAALDPDHPDRAAAASRLPGLLAYEARVEAVSEWILDARSLRRAALYLLIPWRAG